MPAASRGSRGAEALGRGGTARSPLPGPRPQWIMDVLVCNGLGIYCGMKTLEWLSLKTYKWQGLWNIPTYKCVSLEPPPYSVGARASPWGLEVPLVHLLGVHRDLALFLCAREPGPGPCGGREVGLSTTLSSQLLFTPPPPFSEASGSPLWGLPSSHCAAGTRSRSLGDSEQQSGNRPGRALGKWSLPAGPSWLLGEGGRGRGQRRPRVTGTCAPRGKMKRIAFQFTPYSWVRFEWKPASSLRRWLAVCGIILVVRLASLVGVPVGQPGSPPTLPCPPVSVGRAEHLLPEVRAVAAPGALPGPPAAGVLRERGRRGHAGDLRLHG